MSFVKLFKPAQFRWFLFLIVSLLAVDDVLAQKASGRAPLGLNLAGVRDWSSELVFVDAFQAARAWISQAKGQPWGKGGPLDVDERGHLRSLAPGQYAETIVCTGFEKLFPAGIFTCLYDGDGDLDFTGDAKVSERQPGKLKVSIQPRQGTVFARITRTNPKDPLRRLRLIMPGHETTYEKQPFLPEFLERWQGFTAFRFMDWADTNNSKLVEWRDRPTPEDHSQAGKGVAIEYQIAFANTMNAAPWFCLPHRASDDFVRQHAQLVKARLKPNLKIYLEYSNECWNGQFEQARYCAAEGKKLQLSANAYEAQIRYYSQRSVEVFKIWVEVLGQERLVRVIAMQAANPWTGTTALDWHDAYKQTDAIAIAPYFGHRWGNPKTATKTVQMSTDDLIRELAQDVLQSKKHMEAYAAIAKKRNLQLLSYEAGQHLAGFGGAENNDQLTKLFHAANRHPGMKQLYTDYLRHWNAVGGGLSCIFSSMGRFSKWGSWGLLEHAGQKLEETPKWQAVRGYLEGK